MNIKYFEGAAGTGKTFNLIENFKRYSPRASLK
jgi:hypothetical protein